MGAAEHREVEAAFRPFVEKRMAMLSGKINLLERNARGRSGSAEVNALMKRSGKAKKEKTKWPCEFTGSAITAVMPSLPRLTVLLRRSIRQLQQGKESAISTSIISI